MAMMTMRVHGFQTSTITTKIKPLHEDLHDMHEKGGVGEGKRRKLDKT